MNNDPPCPSCGEVKPAEDRVNRRPMCKECHRNNTRRRYRENPEPIREASRRYASLNRDKVQERQREYRERNVEYLKAYKKTQVPHRRAAKYGLTVDGLKALLEAQAGLCPVCAKPVELEDSAVDHGHDCCPGTKSCGSCVRGVLHKNCNRAIGFLGDNPANCARAALYLAAALTATLTAAEEVVEGEIMSESQDGPEDH